jgi:tripartite-type tricarboxylate transporter receptor subunit TctC
VLNAGHVPCKSVPALTQDWQGDVIDIAMINSASALPLYKAGRIKV